MVDASKSLIGKLALGTVQFGLRYGISNTHGQVPADEVGRIIDYCREIGLRTIDTAYSYGESQSVLGRASLQGFEVVTKLPASCPNEEAAERALRESLDDLNVASVRVLLYHRFLDYANGNVSWSFARELADKYGIEKIGFSLYHPDELRQLWAEGVEPQVIQVSYSLLDRRFLSVIKEAKARGVEVHTRSAFLQGLVFRDPHSLSPHFAPALSALKTLSAVSGNESAQIAFNCLAFVLNEPLIDRVVIGTESLGQLSQNIDNLRRQAFALSEEITDTIAVTEEAILNPTLWKL